MRISNVTVGNRGTPMKTFLLSVCAAGVIGILTAAAGTNRVPASATQDTRIDVNRVGKTDRWSVPNAGTILIRTISIPAHRQEEAAARELTACESVVSPLADRVASRRARQCAT